MVNTLDEWYAQAERGTRGDMVYSILKDWKEREQELAELKNLVSEANDWISKGEVADPILFRKVWARVMQAVTIANNDSKEDTQ